MSNLGHIDLNPFHSPIFQAAVNAVPVVGSTVTEIGRSLDLGGIGDTQQPAQALTSPQPLPVGRAADASAPAQKQNFDWKFWGLVGAGILVLLLLVYILFLR